MPFALGRWSNASTFHIPRLVEVLEDPKLLRRKDQSLLANTSRVLARSPVEADDFRQEGKNGPSSSGSSSGYKSVNVPALGRVKTTLRARSNNLPQGPVVKSSSTSEKTPSRSYIQSQSRYHSRSTTFAEGSLERQPLILTQSDLAVRSHSQGVQFITIMESLTFDVSQGTQPQPLLFSRLFWSSQSLIAAK